MTLSLDYRKLAPLIGANTLVLTPNARTQKAIYSGQLSSCTENQVIVSADIRSLSQWQEHLWVELSFYKVLPMKLSKLATKSWIEKLVNTESEWVLTNPSGVATKVLEAYQNLVQWELGLNDVVANESVEIDYFKSWIEKFEQLCQDKNLIVNFKILQLLRQHIDDLKASLPKHILLVGFNQLTPLQQSFFDALKDKNITIDKYNFKTDLQSANQINFTSLKDELMFAAHYANACVSSNSELKQKDKKSSCELDKKNDVIGVVVEDLATNLGLVHQAFSHIFQPQEIEPWVSLSKPQYNVSAGFSLADQSLIKVALLLLNLKSNGITLEELHFLKNTPFICWGEQQANTKHFLHQLCLNPRKNYSIKFLQNKISSQDIPQELSVLAIRLAHVSDSNKKNKSIEDHISLWKETLACWQWGEPHTFFNNKKIDSLSDFEIHAKKTFINVMDKCVSLSNLYDRLPFSESLGFLKQSTQQQTFQIPSDRSNVHVLGVLEASGLQFDKLIIVGFNRSNWPQKNKINPFLPLSLQRENNMPGSSADREYEYAKDLSNSLLSSAKKIIVTSSDVDANSSDTVAPFFSQLPKVETNHFIELASEVEHCSDYQWIDDTRVDLSLENIRGGTYLLSDYAKCPFKAITNYQLNISAYQPIEIGIDPKTKGSWLHQTMELIWNRLASQKALLALSQNDLESLIFDSLKSAMQSHEAYLLAITDAEIIQLELTKLAGLIFEWLSLEKNRDEFSVEQLEKNDELALDDLKLSFRIDRIDRNNNNQVEIIDYKTGKTEIRNWFGVRPTEAQMPAYILAIRAKNISGLSYARIKTGEVAQLGLYFKSQENSTDDVHKDEESILKIERNQQEIKKSALKNDGINSFNDLVSQWQRTLTRIANGITRGYMPVSPKDKNQSCLYCDYQAFCRIDEVQPDD